MEPYVWFFDQWNKRTNGQFEAKIAWNNSLAPVAIAALWFFFRSPNSAGQSSPAMAMENGTFIKSPKSRELAKLDVMLLQPFVNDDYVLTGWGYKNKRLASEGILERKGKEIVKEIAPLAEESVICKSKPSVFYGTPLDSYLTLLKVDTLLVCGCTTSGCVRATVTDAFSRNLHVTVIEECIFDRFLASHKINLFDMHQKYADVVGVEEVKSLLRGLPDDLFPEAALPTERLGLGTLKP